MRPTRRIEPGDRWSWLALPYTVVVLARDVTVAVAEGLDLLRREIGAEMDARENAKNFADVVRRDLETLPTEG